MAKDIGLGTGARGGGKRAKAANKIKQLDGVQPHRWPVSPEALAAVAALAVERRSALANPADHLRQFGDEIERVFISVV